jgi:RNA polymerase sigma-70 factor, ECF subfamily
MSSLVPRPDIPDDRDLVARIRNGDVAAFETLFSAHFAGCYRFAMSFVGDPEIAQDVAQDVFGWVWLHRAEWSPSYDVLSYLLTAIRNRSLDILRARQRQSTTVDRYIVPGKSPAMAANSTPADILVEQEEQYRTIWRVVESLPEQRRTVVLLRWRHSLGWEEIARVMGTSVGAVQVNHTRALKALRERLPDAIE